MSNSTPENPNQSLTGALMNVSDVYLHCRGIQHVWEITQDMHITERTEDGELVERHMHCHQCTTTRKDRWLLRQDRWGTNRLEVLHPTYAYPEDYLMPEMKGVDHAREVLRFEMLTRALGGKRQVSAAVKRAGQNVE